jgi:beta-1,4-N-acetylglucosaminyltransferase
MKGNMISTEKSRLEFQRIFVTVGTTLFDALTESVSESNFLDAISFYGYTHLVIQYGKGSIPSMPMGTNQQNESSGTYTSSRGKTIYWEIYPFKPSLDHDMKNADLIISHAGAGSIMEGLEQCRVRNSLIDQQNAGEKAIVCKKLVVVINDKLMDNHQMELAEALASRGYLMMLTGSSLQLVKVGCRDVIKKIEAFRPKNFEGGDSSSFGILLDQFMGFEKTL